MLGLCACGGFKNASSITVIDATGEDKLTIKLNCTSTQMGSGDLQDLSFTYDGGLDKLVEIVKPQKIDNATLTVEMFNEESIIITKNNDDGTLSQYIIYKMQNTESSGDDIHRFRACSLSTNGGSFVFPLYLIHINEGKYPQIDETYEFKGTLDDLEEFYSKYSYIQTTRVENEVTIKIAEYRVKVDEDGKYFYKTIEFQAKFVEENGQLNITEMTENR